MYHWSPEWVLSLEFRFLNDRTFIYSFMKFHLTGTLPEEKYGSFHGRRPGDKQCGIRKSRSDEYIELCRKSQIFKNLCKLMLR